jgi:hypothetical protein
LTKVNSEKYLLLKLENIAEKISYNYIKNRTTKKNLLLFKDSGPLYNIQKIQVSMSNKGFKKIYIEKFPRLPPFSGYDII